MLNGFLKWGMEIHIYQNSIVVTDYDKSGI